MEIALSTVLVVIALVLTVYVLIKSDGKGPTTWALLFVELALLWPLFRIR